MKETLSIFLCLSLCRLNSSLFRKHFYVNKTSSWKDAQTYCRQQHEDLSTLTFKEARQVITNPIDSDRIIWVGLYNCLYSSLCFWSGGENEPAFWSYNEPNFLDYEKCAAVINYSFYLMNINCDHGNSFFCMEIFELVLVNENKTWEDALDYCRQNYIDLVSMTSENITTDVETNTRTAQTRYVWTGLRFLAGHWFWLSGDGYETWSQNGVLQCPAKNLRCAAMDTEQKVLKPQDCEERLNFFCFKKKP